MRYVATVMLTLHSIEADSKEDAAQYATEEFMNMIDTARVYVKEVE